ncbi:MAG: toprim domain-containing protein [Prevotella sp.]|jgi:DNA primase|nr:toprim domain-containing protein [Prevotella sp.]
MELSRIEKEQIIEEIIHELKAKRDGGNKNLICRCPFCKKDGKFGIYIGRETGRKSPFMSHCFSCGSSTTTLEKLLETISRMDLLVTPTSNPEAKLGTVLIFLGEGEEEIDDSLDIVELPDFYKRCFCHDYLKSRGFVYDDYEYFPAGTTDRLNYKFNDYVIFPIIDESDVVGYVARHIWSKAEIETYNRKAKTNGDYRILRFRNSTENDFTRLLYNYDSIIDGQTDTVIIVEGIFDVIALTRKMELYDNKRIVVIATFGKKISHTQIYKLQSKGIETVVLGYDGDAVEAIKKISGELSRYFNVLIADIPNPEKDWEDLSYEEIYRIFAYGLKTPLEYSINKIQQ